MIDEMLNYQNSFPALDQNKCVESLDIILKRRPHMPVFGKEQIFLHHQTKFVEVLNRRIHQLKELESINITYARKKSPATREINESLSTESLDAVDFQHRTALQECALKHLEERLDRFHQRLRFRRLFNQGVMDCDAVGIEYVPQSAKFKESKRQTSKPLPAELHRLVYHWKLLPFRNYAVKLLGEAVDPRIGREGLLPRLRPTHGVGKKRWLALVAVPLLLTTGVLIKTQERWWWSSRL